MIQPKNSSPVLLIGAIVLACVMILVWSNRGQASARVGWEYKVVKNYPAGPPGTPIPPYWEDPERFFGELGVDGWEFVQFVRNEGGGTTPSGMPHGVWIFKRPR